MRSVLLIEDDESICEVIRVHLSREGFTVDSTPDGNVGLKRAIEGDYNLVLLDLQLQGLGGIDVCKQIRAQSSNIPIIMLTSRDSEIDKVIGLEVGADDYVTKPFSVYELTARIRARLRQPQPDEKPSTVQEVKSPETGQNLVFGDLTIDPYRRKAWIKGSAVELTAREFEVLLFLAEHPGRPFSREELLRSIWDIEVAGYADSVATLIGRLRKKLEPDMANPTYVITVYGVGYRFVESHELSSPAGGGAGGEE